MIKILISSCLLGEHVRYNAIAIPYTSTVLEKWRQEGRLISFCAEVAAGLPVPRPAAEIVGGDGVTVIDGNAKVINIKGKDVTKYFIAGAHKALIAVLKENSPSCGSSYIYDGNFSGRRKRGQGVTTALLKRNGICVFNEKEIWKIKPNALI
ncbi:MAG: DUF523 domain-containing protein [Deltaproteobacteria bacterium]|nr:DUF523 domain-containing protein [Deltaproteobacteria bacterium]